MTTSIIYGCMGKVPEKTGLEGQTLPSFKLLLADSASYFDTRNIETGKPFVLFLFGPYCPYSQSQMEEIIKNMETLKNIHFYVFTAAPFNEMKIFNDRYNLKKYSNVTVGSDIKDYLGEYFHIKGVPYLAIFGKDGRLNKAFLGRINSEEIKELSSN